LSSIYEYQALAAKTARVRLELGVTASLREMLALRPDVLILAPGASMGWPLELPPLWRDEGLVPDLRACMAGLAGFTQHQGGTAVVIDRDATEGTYAAAERLRRLFDRVVLVTPRDRIAEDVPLVNRLGILRRFAHRGIECLTLARVDGASALEDGVVALRNVYTEAASEIAEVALLTYATPRAPDLGSFTAVVAEGQTLVEQVHVIGDAYAPGSTMAATSHGHRIGNLI
jgi:thioredoxin reductase